MGVTVKLVGVGLCWGVVCPAMRGSRSVGKGLLCLTLSTSLKLNWVDAAHCGNSAGWSTVHERHGIKAHWEQDMLCEGTKKPQVRCDLQVTFGGDLNTGRQKRATPSSERVAGAGAQTAICMAFAGLGASNKACRSAWSKITK